MSRHEPNGPGHSPGGDAGVTDADLVRYLDGELSPARRAMVDARLVADTALATRLDTLRRRSARLSDWLGALDLDQAAGAGDVVGHVPLAEAGSAEAAGLPGSDPTRSPGTAATGGSREAGYEDHAPARVIPLPTRWLHRASPALRAAVIVLLLGATLLAVPPARAWVVERVRDAAAALGLGGGAAPSVPVTDPADPAAPPHAQDEGAALGYTFPVASDTFELHLADVAATVVIRRGEDAGSGRIEAMGVPGEGIVFLPRGLRIEGRGEPDVVYNIWLPAEVRAVRVLRAGQPPAVHPLPEAGAELRVEGLTGGR